MISIEQQIKRRKVTMDLNEGKKIDLNEIDNSFLLNNEVLEIKK